MQHRTRWIKQRHHVPGSRFRSGCLDNWLARPGKKSIGTFRTGNVGNHSDRERLDSGFATAKPSLISSDPSAPVSACFFFGHSRSTSFNPNLTKLRASLFRRDHERGKRDAYAKPGPGILG